MNAKREIAKARAGWAEAVVRLIDSRMNWPQRDQGRMLVFLSEEAMAVGWSELGTSLADITTDFLATPMTNGERKRVLGEIKDLFLKIKSDFEERAQ